ncbi:MAG TPA: iron-containing redox enzyme family protein [Kofleriaceae bacterium]|nr:iron-containing redox enzyme family protein [Kofleriaceae bacterium]
MHALNRTICQQGIAVMSLTDHAVSPLVRTISARGDARSAVEAFWARTELSKLEAKFAVAREMDALPRLSIQALRAIALQYRYFTQAFATDLAFLVARCPEGRLRSLLGQLVNEELGCGDPQEAHLQLYDRFLESIGAIEPGASAEELGARVHPGVRELLTELRDRTANKSTFYAIGVRGMGEECVCGVYFSVMHVHLRKHPFIIENESNIDWRFWNIHAGHADLEHNQLVRAAVAELLLDGEPPDAVNEVAAGYDYGTATWDGFWTMVYGDHIQRSA